MIHRRSLNRPESVVALHARLAESRPQSTRPGLTGDTFARFLDHLTHVGFFDRFREDLIRAGLVVLLRRAAQNRGEVR
jgi:hypothetical protein